MSIEAMKQALEALKAADKGIIPGGIGSDERNLMNQAITALRQAIEQHDKQQAEFNELVERVLELEKQACKIIRGAGEQTHTDHPARHWDRTCPACAAESLNSTKNVAESESGFALQEPVACKHKRYSNDVTEYTATCYDCGAEGRMRFVANDTAPPQAEKQEPVAWVESLEKPQPRCVTNLKYRSVAEVDAGVQFIPLYTARGIYKKICAQTRRTERNACHQIVWDYGFSRIDNEDVQEACATLAKRILARGKE